MARFTKLYGDTRGRLARVLAAVRREPTGARPTTQVRVKLDALPAPLRAVVRDESHDGILIEAELPWLTVGSEVQAEFPDGRVTAGRVHWFGVDATRVGSARLRIFVDLSSADGAAPARLPDVGDLRPSPPGWGAWLLATTILVLVASIFTYTLARRPVQPALLPSPLAADPTPPRAPGAVTVPKEQLATSTAAPSTPPIIKTAPQNVSPPRAKAKRKRH